MRQEKTIRPARAVLGGVMIIVSYAMAKAVDTGVTRTWISSLQSVWGLTLIALMVAGVLTVIVALGLLSSQSLASIGETPGKVPSLAQFLAVYIGTLVIGLAIAIYLDRTRGIPGPQSIIVTAGVLFVVSASGRPWWLYATFRRLGWFSAISNETTMRLLLAAIGTLLLLLGLLPKWGAT